MKKIVKFTTIAAMAAIMASCGSPKGPLNAAMQDNTEQGPKKRLELANEYYNDSDYFKAIQLYEVVINERIMVDDLEEVYFKYASAHFAQEDYPTASNLYNSFYRAYPDSDNADTAYFYRALCSYEMAEDDFRLDQTTLVQAMKEFQDYLITFPDGEHVDQARGKIEEIKLMKEEKELHTGRLYYKIEEYKAAISEFNRFIEDYPTSQLVEEAYFEMLQARYELAQNSIERKQKERFELVIEHAGYFLEKYSTGIYASKAKDLIELSNKELKKIS